MTDSIITLSKSAALTAELPVPINERLKKHDLEHSPPGILTCGEYEQESSLAKKNEVGK